MIIIKFSYDNLKKQPRGLLIKSHNSYYKMSGNICCCGTEIDYLTNSSNNSPKYYLHAASVTVHYQPRLLGWSQGWSYLSLEDNGRAAENSLWTNTLIHAMLQTCRALYPEEYGDNTEGLQSRSCFGESTQHCGGWRWEHIAYIVCWFVYSKFVRTFGWFRLEFYFFFYILAHMPLKWIT